jgi:hypothetical protein
MATQQNNEENTKTFSVKMPTWSWQLLNIIAESREHGTNGNDLVKKCLEFIIESAKISGPVPPEYRVLLDMLKLDTSWHGAFNFADAAAQTDIAQVVLILQQHDEQGKPRKGFGLAMIDKPFLPGETPTMTLCVDEILERITEVATPGNYRRLRWLGIKLNTESIRETLTLLADEQTIASLDDDMRNELPTLDNMTDNGKHIEYGKRTKQTKRRTPDSEYMRQQRIAFADEDKELADNESKN